MNITVIGTGRVGLTVGTGLAEMGNDVCCVDRDLDKIHLLLDGELPIYEPGLDSYVQRNLAEGRLSFSTDLLDGLRRSDVVFLTLPTPPKDDGSADLSQILDVVNRMVVFLLAEVPPRYRVVALKSTVPIGTTHRIAEIFRQAGIRTGVEIDVVANPEFLREGTAITDYLKPDRVIVGTSSERAATIMRQLYESFVRQGNPILVMDERSAEMTKYVTNALLASRISIMNEVANLCERVGGDVEFVRIGVGSDHRIGNAYLYAGLGYGGTSFPHDIPALLDVARRANYELPILETVLSINRRQRLSLSHRVRRHFGGSLYGVRAAVWGLSYKPNTDDVRESIGHVVVQDLLDNGAQVAVFDPVAMPATRRAFRDRVYYASSAYDAVQNADVLLICTEWNEFRRPNWEAVMRRMHRPVIFDGRNLYEPGLMAAEGFEYYCIGREYVAPTHPGAVSAPAAVDLIAACGGLGSANN